MQVNNNNNNNNIQICKAPYAKLQQTFTAYMADNNNDTDKARLKTQPTRQTSQLLTLISCMQ